MLSSNPYLCEVATQALIHIGTAQHQQEARAAAHPRRQLCKEEGQHHANASLQ